MKEQKVNHLAVLVAIVLQFVIGAIWYGPLFGNTWMDMVGLDKAAIAADPPGASGWITNIVTAVASVYLLAWLLMKIKTENWWKGALYGFLIGFVFVFLANNTAGAFAKDPYWLPWITGGFTTVALAVAGAVLGGWKKYAK